MRPYRARITDLRTGRHAVVPCAGGPPRLAPLLDCHRHVVRRVHLRGNVHARAPVVPRGLGDRPDLQDLQVSPPHDGGRCSLTFGIGCSGHRTRRSGPAFTSYRTTSHRSRIGPRKISVNTSRRSTRMESISSRYVCSVLASWLFHSPHGPGQARSPTTPPSASLVRL